MPVLEQVPNNYLMKQEDQYEVEKILEHKNISRQKHYLVKWKGYSDSENIWELKMNLDECSEAIEKYHQKVLVSTRKVITQQKSIQALRNWKHL